MRLKVRLRAAEKMRLFDVAERKASSELVPQFKQTVNALPFKQRAKLAWKILRGTF